MSEEPAQQHGIGDGPIEEALRLKMQALGAAVDDFLNGERETRTAPPEVGFVLMCFPLNAASGRMNYLSNANREDVKKALLEQLGHFMADDLRATLRDKIQKSADAGPQTSE